MKRPTEEELSESIERDFGFKRDLIQNLVLCGLWAIRFEVQGIKYYGYTVHSGACPQIFVEGNTYLYHDEGGTPVTEEYYNEYIKGGKTRILRVVDSETGEWEDTGIRYSSQKEAEEYLENLENAQDYRYDFLDES